MTPADERILRQISKKLSQSTSYLRELDGGRFGLFRRAQKSPKPLAVVDTRHIIAWQRADLLTGTIDLTLSAAGRAFLNRARGGFLAQHKLLVEGDETGVIVAQATPLQWLRARPQGKKFGLVDAEFTAGERLAVDYDSAAFHPRQTMDWQRPVFVEGGSRDFVPDVPARIIDARRRLEDALDYIGPGLADVAVAICCAEVGLEVCERGFSLPKRSAKVILKMALMRLSVHYGYQSAAAAAASFRIR